ncbi:ArdC-like ssDNA-binding domain-containing protein [Luteimonas soli]|uniref:ArdC-like ssDNA-binding domain-containing protein n=1 Tax=Luteimonas soli TaxID=1648966 RepID=A0ABV7XGV3_9GAMM
MATTARETPEMSVRNQEQPQQQEQKPALASSKAWEGKGRAVVESQALASAIGGQSVANYAAIFAGFEAKGVPSAEIRPRENVFTFNAWRALGRVVRKGEQGVSIVTVIPCAKRDRKTGECVQVRKAKRTTVFHVTQTEPLQLAGQVAA